MSKNSIWALLLSPALVFGGSPSTWIGRTSSDLNTGSNWTNGVPTDGEADFNSQLPVNRNPTAVMDFAVSTFKFLHSAEAFKFTFTDRSLIFTGTNVGIVGKNTDTTIKIKNVNNLTPLTNPQLYLNGSASNTLGSAHVLISNSGSNVFNSQLLCTSSLTLDKGAKLEVSNSANSTNTIALQIGIIAEDQVNIINSFTAGNKLDLSISNSGMSTDPGMGNKIGEVIGDQFFAESFSAGKKLDLSISNSGMLNGSGTSNSSNQIGDVLNDQFFADSFSAGKQAHISVSNEGSYSGNSTNNKNNTIGSIGSISSSLSEFGQFFVKDAFTIDDDAHIAISNKGKFSGSGTNNAVASNFINALLQFGAKTSFTIGNEANIAIANKGKFNGSGTENFVGSAVLFAQMFSKQLSIGNDAHISITNKSKQSGSGTDTFVGSAEFLVQMGVNQISAGNDAHISIRNKGKFNGSGTDNLVGSADVFLQLGAEGSNLSFSAGNDAHISITNKGKYNGSGVNRFNGVSSAMEGFIQLGTNSFTTGNNAHINVKNQGSLFSSDEENFVASGENEFNQIDTVIFSTGNNAQISVSNRGKYRGSGEKNAVASVFSGGMRIECSEFNQINTEVFSAGNNARISITNNGKYRGSGEENAAAAITNQIITSTFSTDNHARISIKNKGKFSGSGLGNVVAILSPPFGFECFDIPSSQVGTDIFSTGNNSKIAISNQGILNHKGANGDSILVGGGGNDIFNCYQLTTDLFTIGNKSKASISNRGTINGQGSITGREFLAGGFGNQLLAESVVAGNNTRISLSNRGAINGKDAWVLNDTSAGLVVESQLSSLDLIIGNNSKITLSNKGILNLKDSSSVTNSDAGTIFNNQMDLSSFASGNNATISLANSGTIKGKGSAVHNFVGFATNQCFSDPFTVGKNSKISLSNSGSFSGSGSDNHVGFILDDQFFTSTFSSGNNTKIAVSNEGNFNGKSGADNNIVGVVGSASPSYMNIISGQFVADDSFTTGNNANISLANSGSFKGTGNNNQVGYVSDDQFFAQTFTAGNNAHISISNKGSFKGDSGADMNIVGSVGNAINDNFLGQFVIDEAFTVKNDANIAISNKGKFSGSGSNNFVAALQGPDGSLFFQMFASPISIGNDARISIQNRGKFNGSGSGNFVASNPSQLVQLISFASFTIGNDAEISITNKGKLSGSGSKNSVGSGNAVYQLNANPTDITPGSVMTIGKDARLSLVNKGKLSGSGSNNNAASAFFNPSASIGDVVLAQFANDADTTVGKNAEISILNKGKYKGSGSNNLAASSANKLAQFTTTDMNFSAGDNTHISVSNLGSLDLSGSAANNSAAFGGVPSIISAFVQIETTAFSIGNNAVISALNKGSLNCRKGSFADSSLAAGGIGGQLLCDTRFKGGNNLQISLDNSGRVKGNGTSDGAIVGAFGEWQMAAETFNSGKNNQISVANSGQLKNNGSTNSVGLIVMSQMDFTTFTTRNNAEISVSNSGVFSGSGASNKVGFVKFNQFEVDGPFKAGKNLILTASNTAKGSNSSNKVGFVGGSQLFFGDTFTAGDGAFLSAFNSGTVVGPQIYFANGFNIKGKGTIQATNASDIGISVNGGKGGDVNIVLENSSLVVNTGLKTFTIGALNGDSSSFVQCLPKLIINTDSSVFANFNGNIEQAAALIKKGRGTQRLGGQNSYTSLTTIQNGTLVLSGLVAGDIDVKSKGTLAGIGLAKGTVTNKGTISPGESIGTLSMGKLINDKGTYAVQVDSTTSDLIQVQQNAELNGGLVAVSSLDGTFKFHNPYTILTADKVNGTFTEAIIANPLIIPALSYETQEVDLTLIQNISLAATSRNTCRVARQLDNITNPTAFQNQLLNSLVNLTLPEAQAALVTLTGEQHTSDSVVAQDANRQFIRRLYDPLRPIVTTACCCSTQWCGWVEGGGRFSHLNHGFNLNGYQITAGAQKSFGQTTFGLSGSYEGDSIRYRRHGGSGFTQTWLAGLYGLYRPCGYYGLVDLAYGHSKNHMDRKVRVGAAHFNLHSHPEISQFTFYGEAGIDLKMEALMVQPFIAFEAGSNWKKKFTEKGSSGWELTLNNKDRAVVSSRLGLHVTKGGLSVDLAWDCRLSENTNSVNQRFAAFGNNFTIDGAEINRNSFDWAVTYTKRQGKWNFYVEGSGENGSRFNSYNALLGLGLCF